MKYISDIEDRFRRGSTLTRLLMINAGLFVLIVLLEVFLILIGVIDGNNWVQYFQIDRHIELLPSRPWTIITYMFTSYGLWNLLLNLLLLYWFGKIFDNTFTSSQLRGMYIIGSLISATFYLAFFNLLPFMQAKDYYQTMPGASTAILAIASATAFRIPKHKEIIPIIGPVELRYLVIALALIDVALLPKTNPGTDFAHLGAVLSGWWFSRSLRRGHDITAWTSRFFFCTYKASQQISKLTKKIKNR